MRSKARHPAVVAAGAVIVATGLIGLAHAPFARSLLMSLGGCPMAGARMTAAQAESARHMALGADRPGRPPRRGRRWGSRSTRPRSTKRGGGPIASTSTARTPDRA